ncbi:hypothetical protein ABK040_009092 [Willaertia magna]
MANNSGMDVKIISFPTTTLNNAKDTSSELQQQQQDNNIQKQVHELFSLGMSSGKFEKIINSPLEMIMILLFGKKMEQSTTVDINLLGCIQNYYGPKVVQFVFLTFCFLLFLLTTQFISDSSSSIVTCLVLSIFIPIIIVLLILKYYQYIASVEVDKYIAYCKKSKELGNISEYYMNNKEKPDNHFFLAVDSNSDNNEIKVLGQVSVDEWIYPGNDKEDGPFCKVLKGKRVIELRRMSVGPESRKRGVATLLLKRVEEYAKERGFDCVILKTSTLQAKARYMYERNGYKCLDNTQTIIPPIFLYCYIKYLN